MSTGLRDPFLFPGANPMKSGFAQPGVSKPKPEEKWPTIGKAAGGGPRPRPVDPAQDKQEDFQMKFNAPLVKYEVN
jgi:hypothetical protein